MFEPESNLVVQNSKNEKIDLSNRQLSTNIDLSMTQILKEIDVAERKPQMLRSHSLDNISNNLNKILFI